MLSNIPKLAENACGLLRWKLEKLMIAIGFQELLFNKSL